MDISEKMLDAFYDTSLKARVLIKQWYPDYAYLKDARYDMNGNIAIEGKWYMRDMYLMKYYKNGDGIGFFNNSWSNNWCFGSNVTQSVPANADYIKIRLLIEFNRQFPEFSLGETTYCEVSDSLSSDGTVIYVNGIFINSIQPF